VYEKEKEEKSNNVGVTIDITEVAEIYCYRENSSPPFSDMFTCLHMHLIQQWKMCIIILIDKTRAGKKT